MIDVHIVLRKECTTEISLSLSLLSLLSNTDYFSVNLIKNCSAVEIGHSGQYCLSISTSAIILHWRTMAIAHQWSRRNVIKFYRAQREGHLILNIRRSAALGSKMSKRERGEGNGRRMLDLSFVSTPVFSQYSFLSRQLFCPDDLYHIYSDIGIPHY